MRRFVVLLAFAASACAARESNIAAPVIAVTTVATAPRTEVAAPVIEVPSMMPVLSKDDPFSIESMVAFSKVSLARQAKVDGGALKMSVVSVGGKMSKTSDYATSSWKFSLSLAANDLAACVGASSLRKGTVTAAMRVDIGAPKRVVLSGSPFGATVNECLEKELENIDPITNTADPEEPSERATVKLSFDVPADF